MGSGFNVKHGGIIRWSALLSSAETVNWLKGRVMMMDTVGQLRVHDGSTPTATNALATGIAMEARVVNQVSNTVTVFKTGAPTGDRYSMIIDKAVILDDEIRSGINFEPGNLVYTDTAGRLTTSGNGTGPNSPKLGVALSQGRSGDGARSLEFLFDVSY